MTLAATQRAFQAQILDEDVPLPDDWEPGMAAGVAIYRNAYRARLVDALKDTFPRTLEWVSEESFDRAAAHHLITRPPGHWSLDLAGDGFPETLATLFASDPEVPELARLEWDMHLAFVAADADPLDASGFADATLRFTEDDWAQLRLAFVPSLAIRPLRSTALTIWKALSDGGDPPAQMLLETPANLLVWREGLRPVFRSASHEESACLERLRSGDSFGNVCELLAEERQDDSAASEAGAMLGRWIGEGLIVSVSKIEQQMVV